jgi:acetyl-CoA carboxylase biotin carboxyl carrier protein
MRFTVEQLREILAIVEASGCEEFRLETADLKLVVRHARGGTADAGRAPEVVAGRGDGWMPATPAPAAAGPSAAKLPVRAEPVPDGLVPVTAPMVGTFYRAPAPGAPPFVEVGSEVQEADTVGIVEVMKLMNSIAAGVRGRVVQICAENGAAVTQDQPLVLIAPLEAGPHG